MGVRSNRAQRPTGGPVATARSIRPPTRRDHPLTSQGTASATGCVPSPRLRGMITGDDTTARTHVAAVTLSRRVERRHGDGTRPSVFRSAAARVHMQLHAAAHVKAVLGKDQTLLFSYPPRRLHQVADSAKRASRASQGHLREDMKNSTMRHGRHNNTTQQPNQASRGQVNLNDPTRTPIHARTAQRMDQPRYHTSLERGKNSRILPTTQP